MHENNFEKQVREKMDQWGFDPSDEVWTEVDRKINQEKKRRRPLFWILLFSSLMIAAGGIYIIKKTNPLENKATGLPEFSTSKNQGSRQESKHAAEKASAQDAVQPKDQSGVELKSSAGKKSGTGSSGNLFVLTFRRKASKRATVIISQQQTNSANIREASKEEIALIAGDNQNSKAELRTKDSSALANGKAEKRNQSLPGDSVSVLKMGKNDNHQAKTSPWTIAFTGSAGISNIYQGLAQQANSSGYTYFPANAVAYSNPGATALGTPAEMHSGFSFGLGIMVNRKLSKRLSLSTGLGYRFFSTKINTGIPVDSSLVVYTANNQSASVNSFYRNGGSQEHNNQYQFIELPVNLNLQLNKSPRTPVIWEAGLSLAWMISSNALLFDPYTNVYYVNKQSYHTTQWNVATAILVGFPIYNHSIQLGPQFQYGLTGLLKTGADHPGHLYFFGLKMTFIP